MAKILKSAVKKHAWKRLPKEKRARYYRRWIRHITKDETFHTIRQHILRHSREVYKKDPKIWSASMRNLIEIFDGLHKLRPDTKLMLERLERKYRKNPKRYTPPPAMRKRS
jgi:hypothetical protein